jgi:hypothetical protein
MGKKIGRMAGKVAGPKGGWRRKWSTVLSLVIALGLAMVVKQTLFAVHEFFALEGDVVDNGLVDWEDLFNTNGTTKTLPIGIVDHADLTPDYILNANGSFNNADFTTYATGSKDTLPVAGWQCTRSNNVTDKDDIINAYAATATVTVAGVEQQILYFGIERNARTGSANVGFWFLQNGDIGCTSPGGSTNFTGEHMDGDLLIVSEFSNGGDVSTIKVYRWNGGASGSLSINESASGGDCRDEDFPTSGDTVCGAANRVGIDIPWLTIEKTDGVGHTLRQGEFFEGGLNLSLAGLAGKCFNTFMANTRSAPSTTANLFDYTQGTIGECGSSVTTQSSLTGTVSIGTGTIPNVSDTATIEVDGADSFSATVTFYLCGPSATAITPPCDADNGVQIGTPQSVTANGPKTSDSVTLSSVGEYCWGAVFSGDPVAAVPGSQDDGTNECFTVGPVAPTITTTAGDDVDFGLPVTDTATISGLATAPGAGGLGPGGTINATTPGAIGGTLEVTLYGPGAAPGACGLAATGTGTNPQSVGVTANGSVGPVSFTPDAPGDYAWAAEYTPAAGDPNNIANSHNTNCAEGSQDVTVSQIPTQIKSQQDWIPNDTVTITSTVAGKLLPTGGSVVFTLHESANCSGTPVYSRTKSLTGGALTEVVSTDNTGSGANQFKITTAYTDGTSSKGPFTWKVVYTPPAGSAFVGRQSSCATAASTESFTINYHNDEGPGTAP